MSMRLYDDTDIQDIADAIRAKNGSSSKYTTAQMAAAISAIPTSSGVTLDSVGCTTTVNGSYIGDADGDGVITSSDQQMIAEYNSGYTVNIDLDAADINGDGVVDSADNILLTRLVSSMTTGQILARVTLGYSDGNSENRIFAVDAPYVPSNISKIAAGSYTPASDITSSDGVTITHGLEVVPDLIVMYTTDLTWGSSVGTAGAMLGCVAFVNGSSSTSMAYKNIVFRSGTGSSTTFASPSYSSTSYGIGTTPTTTSFTVKCGSNYKLVGGDTYTWIAIKFK